MALQTALEASIVSEQLDKAGVIELSHSLKVAAIEKLSSGCLVEGGLLYSAKHRLKDGLIRRLTSLLLQLSNRLPEIKLDLAPFVSGLWL